MKTAQEQEEFDKNWLKFIKAYQNGEQPPEIKDKPIVEQPEKIIIEPIQDTIRDVFTVFQEEFTYWQQVFGLDGYKVYYKFEPLCNSYAEIHADQELMATTVILNSELNDEELEHFNPQRVAKHEALHLLIGRLAGYANNRFISEPQLTESIEELVNKLDKLIGDLQ